MKILYISSVTSEKQYEHMKGMVRPGVDNVKYGMIESGYKFHHLLMDGIVSDTNNSIYSLVGRATSREAYKGLFWKTVKEMDPEKNIQYKHIGFINLPLIKNLIVSLSYFFNVLFWILQNKKEEKCIIVDAAYVTVIPFVNLATKIAPCKKVSIVCDIYEYMADVKDADETGSKFNKFFSKMMKKNYSQIDGFVFLTQQMDGVLNKENKPYIVMEGLVDVNMGTKFDAVEKNSKDVVVYAGAIRKQYGLENLIEGYHNYKNDNSELWIFGSGDYVPEVMKKAEEDQRIKYFGLVPNKEVVKKELEATLLVNPRPSDMEFARYSFPSKNMEYMVSGTPLLTTDLPGMPEEYKDYVYIIEENSPDGVQEALEKTLSLGRAQLFERGRKSKEFVLNKKNNVAQGQRVLGLCKEVMFNENGECF